jgi:hypothetical protein
MERPQQAERFNALPLVRTPEFDELSRQVKQILAASHDSDQINIIARQYQESFDDLIGEECLLHEATISGFAHVLSDDNELTGVIDFIAKNDCIFSGVLVRQIGRTYAPMLEVIVEGLIDKNGIHHERKSYALEPKDVTSFEIINEEPIMDTIRRHAEIAHRVTSDPHFYTLTLDDQIQCLLELSDNLEFDLPMLEEVIISVDAEMFGTIAENEEMKTTSQRIIDQSHISPDMRFRPSGTYLGYSYAECAYREFAFKSIDDFDIAKGYPTIKLYNHNMGVMYLVPIHYIRDVDNIVLPIIDENGDMYGI